MELRWRYNYLDLQLCQRHASLDILLYFSRFLLRFVLQLSVKKFSKFQELLFPKNLLVAAANRFEVLKTFISLKITVYIQDHGLRFEKALDAQGFEWKSNCTEMAKYTCDFKRKKYCYIYVYIQQNLAKQFTFHSVEVHSEPFPFPTSKQGNYLIGGNYFHKNLHLRCLKRF